MERKKGDPEVSARLQEECRSRGWNQKKLGEEMEISRTFASQVWNGSVPIGPKNLRRLADLGFDLNWLISGQQMMGGITQDQINKLTDELEHYKFYTRQLERLLTSKEKYGDEKERNKNKN